MKEIETYSIAVLITCYNRKMKTINFLESLTSQDFFKKGNIDVYLLDDGSTDGLTDYVKLNYPDISILIGNGNLFWAGGMRTIWQYAIEKKKYDLFALFNDDVVLFNDAIERLINCYQKVDGNGAIIIGSTISPKSQLLSYGGHRLYKMNHAQSYAVKPDPENAVQCQFGNANVLLVDSHTITKIGIFSDVYIHAVADFDYTLTAFKRGINVLLAPGYYGYCEDDHGANWLSGNYSLKERINYLYSPKGLAYKEYLLYIKKHFPLDYFEAFAKLWLKTFFPIIWDKFKKIDEK
jgi:GT2 family glycosyltransferase